MVEVEYPLLWEAVKGSTVVLSNIMQQSYSLIVLLAVPFPAINPKIAIPIQIFDSPTKEEDLEDFVNL